jgi:hypothetical protein
MKKRDGTERVLYRLVLVVCTNRWRHQCTYKGILLLLLSSSSVGGKRKKNVRGFLLMKRAGTSGTLVLSTRLHGVT